tara:strand:+ start:1912 stop:2190 length:279 start_codon:yes stop_codon:yes gene_type:complete
MESKTEEVAVEDLITDGGYHYIENEDGLKVRNSIIGRRIKEDGETFDEYKMRQKFVNNFDKEKSRGTRFWKNELGTYDKKKVEEFIKENYNG